MLQLPLVLISLTVGARGEDLASAMMDLHGLQEALDGLSEWVDEAEAKMTYNEGLLLTNSLDDIEDQLQEHEVTNWWS